ncbi:MAG: Slp family lipoprotein [bacterium]
MREWILLAVVVLVMGGCNTLPETTDNQITPGQLSGNHDLVARGSNLRWGGEIVSVENYASNTVLEIIAYPLNASGEPSVGQASTGRFLADRKGFLEPREYKPGRRVTISGPLLGFQDRPIGQTQVAFPALDAQQIQIWGDSPRQNTGIRPRVNIGVSGGSGGGRVGVGVGF